MLKMDFLNLGKYFILTYCICLNFVLIYKSNSHRGIVSMVSTMVSKTTSLSSSLSTPAKPLMYNFLIVHFNFIRQI